ncbi:hypothetical protein PHLCEN_2v13290 [Hermanssonia centrifuga]|uniref:Cytochrome P450 n=1 Tax=Hermanssonia centrifuga TaxID=98765 RepID=A0A2R6NEZ5_9APHY|nr:hypothetical protein PHLCEN_2v13290 [Hermanssonia centrifuga]
MDAFKAITMTFATYYAALCSSVTLYRLSPFHPLARYPGPIMCKASTIWVAYVASKGKQHLYIQDLHRRYGDAVRIGPNEISFRNTDVINPLMGSRGLPKGPNWDGRLFQNPMHAMISIQDPQEHFIRRKPWSRAFNTGSLKELQPLLAARVEQLVEAAITQKGVVDLSKWINFFTYVTNEDNRAERPLSPLKVLEDGLTAIIAGTDTTSSTLCNVFFFLITYPKVHEQLQAEVDCYYPPGEDALDPQHHPKMVYLEAVIFLPEGNQARLHFYSVHRDPRNFSNPDSFWPERWLIAGGNMTSSEELVHNPNAFVPFSHGPSNCVGKPLAMREMRTVICQMVQKVNMRFAPGWNPQDWERDMEDRFNVKKGPLPVIVEKRD